MLKNFYDKWGNFALSLLSVIIILLTLFFGDNVGLSDNGDFSRVMRSTNLQFTEERELFYTTESFTMNLTEDGILNNLAEILFESETLKIYPSIHILFVRVSEAVNILINLITGSDISLYRISVLGIIYTICYGVVLFFLFREIKLKNRILDVLSKLIIIIVLCDVGYVAYFNSLYSEPVQIIGFIWLAACLLRILNKIEPSTSASVKDMVLFFAAAVLYGWSKFANIPGACLLMLVFGLIIAIKNRKKLMLLASLLPIGLLVLVYMSLPVKLDLQTNFNSVFFGIVKDTDEETTISYLEELGLPDGMIEFAGKNYYGEGVKARLEESEYFETFSELSKADLLIFYLKHPALLMKGIKASIENSSFIRPFYLGNYGASQPRLTFSGRFSLWSSIRMRIGTDTVLGNLAVFLGFAAIMLLLLRKTKDSALLIALAAILCVFVYNLVIPIVANGEGDLAKHMFAYVQIIDVFILFVLISGLNALKLPDKPLIPTAAIIMALALLFDPISSAFSRLTLLRKTHERIEPGAYVNLGSYGGEKLIWLVAEVNGETVTLICVENIASMDFDDFNSNYWEESSIRGWLNSDFLESFSEAEQNIMLETEHTYILSAETRQQAQTGDRDFYCFHTPAYAARGAERAYSSVTQDTITLPDITLISGLYELGYDISGNYWLETPYYSNGSMLRYAAGDGYIYMRDAKESCGVRPVIYISPETDVSGEGSFDSPFYINLAE